MSNEVAACFVFTARGCAGHVKHWFTKPTRITAFRLDSARFLVGHGIAVAPMPAMDGQSFARLTAVASA